MALSPRHPAAPSLSSLAELVHRAPAPRPSLVSVQFDHQDHAHPQERDRHLSLGTWPVPADAEHPADPLVGFVAPAHWDVVGLSTAGRVIDLTETTAPAATRVTVLADRAGAVASLVGPPGGAERAMAEAPSGWVADVLARTFGLATAAPTDRLARWVETAWLDTIATATLSRPGTIRCWSTIARLHPLHPPGRILPAALLAVEAEALELESGWRRVRHLWQGGDDGPDRGVGCAHPPGGHRVPLERWFDDGSFSRWVQRNQPPADALLPAVLDALPHDVGAQLVDALITVTLS